MIVHLNLTVGFKVIRHQHNRDGNIAEFVDLKEKGKTQNPSSSALLLLSMDLGGVPNTPEAVFEAI